MNPFLNPLVAQIESAEVVPFIKYDITPLKDEAAKFSKDLGIDFSSKDFGQGENITGIAYITRAGVLTKEPTAADLRIACSSFIPKPSIEAEDFMKREIRLKVWQKVVEVRMNSKPYA